ncbi:hypothetical protein DICPUDRAFT_13347, partial [Dictyostelium purpureum]
KNYYETLKVSIDAPYEEIKKSYRKLVLLYHPDKISNDHSSFNSDSGNVANKEFNEIQKSWETLKDDALRKQYDALLLEQQRQKYSVSDEVDLDDMEYLEEEGQYTYPCRCGDQYIITEDQLSEGNDVVCCSGCSLSIKIIY